MDFKNMITFLKVAELRSFSQAADTLGYSQSAVSTQIAKLESELNKCLFDRIGHKIYLTESGKLFQQYVQNVLLLTENLEHALEGHLEVQGTIRLATSDSLCSSLFTSLFVDYQKCYPNVQFHIRTGLTDEMLHWLSHNEIDLIYTLDHCIRRPDLTFLKETPEHVHFYVAASHPLLKQKNLTLDDLSHYPLYLTEQGVSYRKLLDQALAELGHVIIPTVESGNVEVIHELIQKTDGIGFIPEFVVKKDLQEGSICSLPLTDLNITVWKQLIHHKGKALTPAMQRFITFIP